MTLIYRLTVFGVSLFYPFKNLCHLSLSLSDERYNRTKYLFSKLFALRTSSQWFLNPVLEASRGRQLKVRLKTVFFIYLFFKTENMETHNSSIEFCLEFGTV